MRVAKFWSAFDTTTVDAGAKGFEGAAFDGRYIYFAPYTGAQSGIIARYDTQATFDAGVSWATFDLTAVDPAAKGFAGAVFDGRYIYLAPRSNVDGLVVRYDTQAAFGVAASWSKHMTTNVNVDSNGFVGATFDGRYIYFVPYRDDTNAFHGVIARYDTKASFDLDTSWSTFNVATVNAAARGFYGAVFDGRYLYLVPWLNDVGVFSGVVARYDTQATFTIADSWTTFDTTTVNVDAKGFGGGAFDGRYLYLVPANNGIVARYDTTAPFAADGGTDGGAVGGWTTYDATMAFDGASGFTGATFDGRYIYFAPFANPGYHGHATRYDTQGAFTTSGSWSTFDTSTIDAKSVGFVGTVFDGRAVYFAPCTNGSYTGEVTRFLSKAPASMPNLYGDAGLKFYGSFF
jgi:hypothetical protein